MLFITQKVDKDDDILGVYHRWIEKLAERLDMVYVICLYKGCVELPANVEVFSLGKEKLSSADLRGYRRGLARIKYSLRFWRYIWRLRRNCDAVFVHMNPIYVVLGGLFWKALGKRVLLWYNHPLGGLTAKAGILFADKVFCTSPHSFSAKYKKTSLMPAGIDTNFFRPMPEVSKDNKRILCLGRISPIKNIEHLIQAAEMLYNQGLDFKVLIVGSAGPSAIDKEYELRLKKMSADLSARGRVEFKQAIPNGKTPEVYNSSGIFVNLTPTGSFDKTILEAMACGLPVLVSNKALADVVPGEYKSLVFFKEKDAVDLAEKINACLKIPQKEREKLGELTRQAVLEKHSLLLLAGRLADFVRDHSYDSR